MLRVLALMTALGFGLFVWGQELGVDKYRVSFGLEGTEGQIEFHHPGRANQDRDTLIYRGSARFIHLYQKSEPSVRLRVCAVTGCANFNTVSTETKSIEKIPAQPSVQPTVLFSTRRSFAVQRMARKNEPPSGRALGLVEIDVLSLGLSCNEKTPAIGRTYEINLPGLRHVKVRSHRLIENQDQSWSWYAMGVDSGVVLNLNAGNCDSRPYGALTTQAGAFWIRPMDDSQMYAVYKL